MRPSPSARASVGARAAAPLRALFNSARIWEWEIGRYERADRRHPPPRGTILFTGSSTIRLWHTLERDMAPLAVLNRGFGGAHLAHVTRYAARIVLPYEPAAIVLYAGDNDLGWWTGKDADSVLRDFDRFCALVRRELPGTRLYFISIKPSRLRNSQWPEQRRVNELVAERAASEAGLEYLDIATPMLAGRSRPARDLFRFDGLHLRPAGYEIWTEAIRPALMRDLGVASDAARRTSG
jgi:lysophospholipase L1-like esterase